VLCTVRPKCRWCAVGRLVSPITGNVPGKCCDTATRNMDNCCYPSNRAITAPRPRFRVAPMIVNHVTRNGFWAFLADRAIRKPSPHTTKAYRQDFAAIATLLAGDPGRVVQLTPDVITKDAMQTAFAAYADTHEAASIRRCWSNWNTLCDFLYTGEPITANPTPRVGRPKVAKTLPKGLGADTVSGLLAVIDLDHGSGRRSDRAERDRAIVLTRGARRTPRGRARARRRRRHPTDR
jgi:hypothetical protein